MSDTDSIGLSRLAYVFHRVRPSQLMPHVDAINAAAVEAQINTVDRWSMWLAQLGHESEQFTVFEERLSYSAEALLKTWPTHFDAAAAQGYQHQPERIANRAYAGRLGNGDEESGDGSDAGAGDTDDDEPGNVTRGRARYFLCGNGFAIIASTLGRIFLFRVMPLHSLSLRRATVYPPQRRKPRNPWHSPTRPREPRSRAIVMS